MRDYELMVILDPNLDERTVTPSLETFLRVITGDGGTVEKVDVWGKRRMAYEINKHVLDVTCEPATVAELDRQLSLNESVLRTKVMRRVVSRKPAKLAKPAAAAPPVPTPAGPRPSAPSPTPVPPAPES